jgi:hypothetical protein
MHGKQAAAYYGLYGTLFRKKYDMFISRHRYTFIIKGMPMHYGKWNSFLFHVCLWITFLFHTTLHTTFICSVLWNTFLPASQDVKLTIYITVLVNRGRHFGARESV